MGFLLNKTCPPTGRCCYKYNLALNYNNIRIKFGYSMSTLFTITENDLEQLSPEEAVEIFRDLVWAEIRRLGIPISKVHISSRINVPDGGVDAFVEENEIIIEEDLIIKGRTAYQIKTGISFKPWQDSKIKKELFGKKHPCKENLSNSIRDCLDHKGTYIIVCFGVDLVDSQRRQAVNVLKYYLKQCKYESAKVAIWSQNNLISFIKIFPSIALRINRRDNLKFQTHKSWSYQEDMRKKFISGKAPEDFIMRLQTELRRNHENVHVRVLGDPGIGKTRLVFEAIKVEDLQPFVIYCDTAINFRYSELTNEILRDDNSFSIILVLDECNLDTSSYIWNKFKNLKSKIKLISIYNEYEKTSGNINYLYVPFLAKDLISEIIQSYSIPRDQADRWAPYCSGSPMVAHVFGQNLIHNPDDLLQSPDTVNVWDRYIVGIDIDGSQIVRQRRTVLRYLSLFKRFGFGRPVIVEAQTIAKLVEKADRDITWFRFQEIIHELKSKKIIQGENTLYITPKALHIYLWTDWWEIYGEGFNFEEFSKTIIESLRKWFYEMFIYAGESKNASQVVKELLGENGLFKDGTYLKTKHGAGFFSALAESDPKSALELLKSTIGTWSKDELLKFKTGRREVIWALEKIAVWQELFQDAAKLLLSLGEAETESYSNNASGVFAELFSPGYGQLAPTELSPKKRFPIIKEALESDSKERRLLALQACNKALGLSNISRSIGAEYQGLRTEPQFWTPQTNEEFYEAYIIIWQFLQRSLDNLAEDERQQAINIFTQHIRGLGTNPNLSEMVLETIYDLLGKSYFNKQTILSKAVEIIHYDGPKLPSELRKKWEKLKDELTGSDYSSLMERFVGMDLMDDYWDDKGKYNRDIHRPKVIQLAKQSLEKPNLLENEIEWLVTSKARNGYKFGYELGKIDSDLKLVQTLYKAQSDAGSAGSVYFLSGYFRGIFENNQEIWESQLDNLIKSKKLRLWIPEITWRSAMTDRAAIRILKLAKDNIINVNDFQQFSYGSVIINLSEKVFVDWIGFLYEKSNPLSISIAIQLCNYYYFNKEYKRDIQKQLSFKLLTHPLLYKDYDPYKYDQMMTYYWQELAKEFVNKYPEDSIGLAEIFIKHFGEDNTIVEGYYSETHSVLFEILSIYPEIIWGKITPYLDPPFDAKKFNIRNWLRGGKFHHPKQGAISIVPIKFIFEWVDQKIEKRAKYLATFIPKDFTTKNIEKSLVRNIIIRYGSSFDVRANLISNYQSESFSGPSSRHYQRKKEWLLELQEVEDNENVILWISEYIDYLEKIIEQAKIDEERRGY